MLNKIYLLLICVTLITANAISAEPSALISIDSETGEVISVLSKGASQKTVQPSTPLCLEGQTVIEVRTDGTVRCYDKSSNTETSYINIDLKYQQDALSNNTYKTTSTRLSMMCPEGKALTRLHDNGSMECK